MFKPAEEKPDLSKPVQFERKSPPASFGSNDKASSALFLTMAGQMKPLPVRELIARAAKEHGLEKRLLEDAATKNLLRLFLAGFVSLWAESPKCAEIMPAKPKAYKLARYLTDKPNMRYVTNMVGESVPIDQYGAQILKLADGTRSPEEIAEEFDALLKKSGNAVMEGGQAITDPAARKKAIAKLTDTMLHNLLRGCVLVE
jgi:methyltransferase-like protein